MSLTFSRTYITGLLLVSLMLPFFVFAHEPHPADAPPHPVGSPDYHPIDTTTAETSVSVVDPARAELEAKLALLLQLIDLLTQQLALRGVEVESAETNEVTSTSGRTVEVDTEYVTIYTESGYRYFESKAIPNHDTGTFPNAGNPNTISEQDLTYKVTLNPVYTGKQTPVQLPGIALNGIPMEPGTAEREGDYNIEGLQDTYNLGMDYSNAHVQPTGLYHYHGVPEGYLDTVATDEDMVLVGYAADGFPMYHSHSGAYTSGWELVDVRSDGTTPDGTYTQDFEFTDAGNLDECNGAWIDDDTYAYFVTDEFPYIQRCVNGTSDSSFAKGPGTGGQGAPPNGGQPPRF